jgi:hypothetical protein
MSERGVPVTGVSELVPEVQDLEAAEIEEIAFDGAGRAAYVKDPDGNVVELWTWDVAGHLR